MKVKEIVISLLAEDISNFIKLQNKVIVDSISIDKSLNIDGFYPFMGININFEASLMVGKVENNSVYLDIESFKILKMNIINALSKKAFNYFISAFSDISGVSFEGEYFKLDVANLINRYYKEQSFVNINYLEVNEVKINKDEVEIHFGGIHIDTTTSEDVPYVEAEIVNDPNLI